VKFGEKLSDFQQRQQLLLVRSNTPGVTYTGGTHFMVGFCIKESNMERFWELLQESVLVQGSVTLVLVVTLCFMFATGRPVPDTLIGFAMLVLGFWFGTKSQRAIVTTTKAMVDAIRRSK
jgi:hypothetical protein